MAQDPADCAKLVLTMNDNPHQQRNELKDIAYRAMRDRGLLPDFSPAIRHETEALREPPARASSPPAEGPGGAVDLRGLWWASIDNDDSRDLDQLSVAEVLPDGNLKLLVAIADVDALVPMGSATDEHAEHNTTSVYTAAVIFPMLPERLSTDLTSLNEDADRLAMVIEMTIDPQGNLVGSNVYRALVRNRAKLAYNSVAAWLDGAGPPPPRVAASAELQEQLRIQDQGAKALRSRRQQNGILNFATIEAHAVFISDLLSDIKIDTKNRAKELIEDFMIAANGVTSRYLAEKGFPSVRRVLRAPKRWPRIVALAAEFGEALPAEPDSAALGTFLVHRRQHDPVGFPDLSLSVVKLMGAGEYVLSRPGTTAPGHFGLAVRDYTHSTAPNRRFPDLITQRLLKAAIAGRPVPYSDEQLGSLAQHCTEMEDAANKVERQVRKSAAAMLLESRVGQRFAAIVTGAAAKGTYVRLLSPPVEGRVVRGAEGLDVGDRCQVELLGTDVQRGFIDFARV